MSGPVKLDPIWLDTNVVAAAANGNAVTESFLQKLHDDGHELLLVPAANNELLYGNPLTMNGNKSVISQVPSDTARGVIELVKVRLGITVDMSAGALERSTRVGYAMQDHVKRPKNQAVPASLRNISESDSLVLSQIMASAQARNVDNPIMVTRETGGKGMISQSHLYGVTVMKVPPPGGGGSSVTPGPSSPSSEAESGVSPTIKANPLSGKLTAISMTIARTVVGIGATLLLQYLAQILMQKITKSLVDQRMKEFEPEIQRFATAYGRMIIDNVASGTPAYVTSRVRIEYPIQYAQGGGLSVDVVSTLPLTNLDAISITERDQTGQSKHTLGGGFGGQTDVHEYTFSVSVGSQVTKEQVATYRAVNTQIKLYQMALRNAVNAMASRGDIQRELQELMDALDETFGGGFQFTPDRKLWTSEGYDAMVGATGGIVYSGLPEMKM